MSRAGGKKAQSVGRGFEDTFETECLRRGVGFVEIPDGCRVFGRGKMFRAKTPFDCVIEYGGKSAIIDTKTTEQNSFTFSQIKEHQLKAIALLTRNNAMIGGYVVYFRKANQIVLFTGNQLAALTPGDGLKHGEGAFLGSIETFDPRLIFQKEV